MLKKKFVLDSTVFCEPAALPKGELWTTTEVTAELRSEESNLKFELADIRVGWPTEDALKRVKAAANETNDLLSAADLSVIALAIEKDATIVSDDYGIQNLAMKFGLAILPLSKRGIREMWTYGFRCKGCGRRAIAPGICTVCGSEIRRFRIQKG